MSKLFKYIPSFIIIILLTLHGCGKQLSTLNNISPIPENNISTNKDSNSGIIITGTLSVPSNFVTSLSSTSKIISKSSSPYSLTNATITLKDITNPDIDITKQITGCDSFRSNSNGNFAIPFVVTDTPVIIEASIGGYRFISTLLSVSANIHLLINNETTIINSLALQTGYDSLMNIKFTNIDNLAIKEFASNIYKLKNILSLESNYTDFDKFRNNTTIDLIRALSNGNKNNINKKDSALKIIKEKIISTGKNILCANKSLISNNLIWKPAYIKSIFETNYNEPLNVNLPENTDCDNIILKYKFNDPSSVSGQLLDNNNLSGNPNYSTPGSISGEEPETNDSLNGYYSGNSKDEIKIISATCLYPASGSGFVQWSTTYEGSHGYVIYLCDTPTPSITNYTIENPISTQSITADAGGHTTIYNELLSNLKRYQYKIKALYIIILKSNTEICSNGLEIQYTDIPYNTTYNGAYSETYYQETTDLPPYYGSKNTYLSKEKEISTATTTTTTMPLQEQIQYYYQY